MMNRLFRKYWYLTVVALLCCAPMAFGQATETMTLLSTVTGNPSQAGIYTGEYPFSINGSPATTYAMCDDFADQIYIGESWTAQVNTFANIGSNVGSGGPKWGSQTSALQEYQEAAWLVTQMPGNAASVSNISYALWQIFDPPGSGTAFQWLAANDPNAANDLNGSIQYSAQWWYNQAALSQNYTGVDTNDFQILTPTGAPTCGGGACATAPPQEFLVYTPESSAPILLGSDLLGLAALIFFFRRRMVRTQS